MFGTRGAFRIRAQGATGIQYARRRLIHSSPSTAQNSMMEKVTSVADKANKAVGKGLASAIDKGEKAAHEAKETIASVTKDTTKGKKGEEALGKMKEKAKQNGIEGE